MGDFINQEIRMFLESAFYGMILGLSYDMLRILRRIIKHKNIIVYIEDYLFWTVWGVMFFALIFNYNDGNIRAYVFAAILAGVVLYIKGISPFLVKYVTLILGNIFTLVLKKPIKAVKMFVSKLIGRLMKNIKKGINKTNGITHRKKSKKE